MKVGFIALAQQELDDAVAWYNEQATGLGQEFLDELDRAVRRAVTFPISCPEIEPGGAALPVGPLSVRPGLWH